MTPKVRSQARSGKSPNITGSKSAGKQSASQQTSPKSKSSTEDTGKLGGIDVEEMSVEEKVGQLLLLRTTAVSLPRMPQPMPS